MDIGALVNISPSLGAGGLQQLPSASMSDVKRFDDILKNGTSEEVNPSKVEEPILQLNKMEGSDSVDFKTLLINKAADIDAGYHDMLSRFDNMPRFSDYLAQSNSSQSDMRTYPNVSADKDFSQTLQDNVKSTRETLSASSDYQRMLTRWGANMQMWDSKMHIVTAAVSLVSQGFKTLFRAAG